MSTEVIEQAQKRLPGVKLDLISQGAEALVFVTENHPYLPKDIKPASIQNPSRYIIKFRPSKPYRHPKLDRQINKSRTASEAKLLHKLYQLNVTAPKLIATDAPNGLIWMEFIGGYLPNGEISSLKNYLWYIEKQQEAKVKEGIKEGESQNSAISEETRLILNRLGKELGILHLEDIVHGDLTSSNIILVSAPEDEDKERLTQPVLIDFGLSSYSNLVEDKAVDLYLLERALTSTHPVYARQYHDWILEGYLEVHKQNKGKNGLKKHVEIIRRLEDVRMRGRKRSMIG